MSRARWRLTLLALAATIAAIYPITSLFTPTDWFWPAGAAALLVVVVGALLRLAVRSRWLVLLAQAIVTTYAILAAFAGETFDYLLPSADTVEKANAYGLDALQTIQTYTAPAPLTPGVTFCLVAAAALVALAVDGAAATWESPAAAGLPLLAAYLITAANGADALQLSYFLPPVLIWLAMLHLTARSRIGRWESRQAAGPGEDDEPQGGKALRSLSSGALRFGALAILLALVLPAVIPHFPPRYLTEGLGRSTGPGGTGTVGLSDSLDLTLSLKNTDTTPVLRYTTTAPSGVPLRVTATSTYVRGEWLPTRREGVALRPLPTGAPRTEYVMRVTENAVRAPGLAAPYPVIAADLGDVPWSVDPVTRDIKVGRTPSEYEVTYADNAPTSANLRNVGTPSFAGFRPEDLALPDSSRQLLLSWAATVTEGRTNELDKAIAIQDHLRDPNRYTYTLDLGAPVRDSAGRILDPVRTFYETRRGYCVQFATAMVLLARAEGIPARMAIGFLPGSRNGKEYVVRAADAHAWPELYFAGYGWLRFEPTPGQRSGTPPAYATQGSPAAPGPDQTAQQQTPTGTATSTARRPDTEAFQQDTGGAGTGASSGAMSSRSILAIVAVLLGLVAVFLMPVTAKVVGIRRRRAARDEHERLEVEWDELTSHLDDLGLSPPTGGTLRQWRDHFVASGHLDSANAEAVGRVTATLERARYDRPGSTSAEDAAAVHRDLRAIRRTISRTRVWRTRLRSFLWPSAGVRAWRRLGRRRGGAGGGSTLP